MPAKEHPNTYLRELIDELARKRNLTSDYQIAGYLNVSKQAVSQMKKTGKAGLPTLIQLANEIGIPPAKVIRLYGLENAKSARESRIFLEMKGFANVGLLTGIAGVLVAVLTLRHHIFEMLPFMHYAH